MEKFIWQGVGTGEPDNFQSRAIQTFSIQRYQFYYFILLILLDLLNFSHQIYIYVRLFRSIKVVRQRAQDARSIT